MSFQNEASRVFDSVKKSNEDNYKWPNIYNRRLYNIWKNIFGFYGLSLSGNSTTSIIWKIWSNLVLVVQLLITVQVTASFCLIAEYSAVVLTGFMSYMVPNFLACIFAISGRLRLSKFNSLMNSFENLHPTISKEKERKLWALCLLFIVSLFFINVAALIMDLLYTFREENKEIVVGIILFSIDVPESIYNLVVFVCKVEVILQMVFLSLFVTFNVVILYFVCNKLAMMFEQFNSDLEACLRDENNIDFTIEKFRLRHQKLCEITSLISKLFSPSLMFLLLSCSIHVIFCARGLKLEQESFTILLYFVFVMIKELLHLFLIFQPCISIHREAHSGSIKLLNRHYESSENKSVVEKMRDKVKEHNYLLFVLRLTCTNVGINVSEFFILNSASLLSLAGAICTYVVILYQMVQNNNVTMPTNSTVATNIIDKINFTEQINFTEFNS